MRKRRRLEKKMLAILVLVILFLNISATIFLLTTVEKRIDDMTARAAEGTASLCINDDPTITVPCSANLTESTAYYCQLGVSDSDTDQNHTYSEIYSGVNVLNLSSTGVINFTPTNSHVGEHTTTFIVTDTSGCVNFADNYTFVFNVTNVNNAPYLSTVIDDMEFAVSTTYRGVFLNDHFTDADGDALTYSVTTPPSPFSLQIEDDSEVIVTAGDCSLEETYVIFTAKDPFNATGDSNQVKLKVTCTDTPPSTGTTGGGGGGGGGSNIVSTCRSDWDCTDWLDCLPTGYEWRHCYDLNGCEDTRYFKQECNYVGALPECEENWICEEWNPCLVNSTQYRICDDFNECGTNIFRPELSQICTYDPTCFDGIQNGGETDVDCGGPCDTCPFIEGPLNILKERFDAWLLAFLLICVILIIGIGRIYHEQLSRGLARLALLLLRSKRKELMLYEPEKQELLEKLLAVEREVMAHGEWPATKKYEKVTRISRLFFARVTGLPMEFRRENLELSLKKWSDEIQTLLLSYYDKVYLLEAKELPFTLPYFFALTEELRTIICSVSNYTVADVERPLFDFPLSNELSYVDETLIRMIYAYRALQFHQDELAEKEYLAILKTYEDLPLADQEPMYPEITRIFSLLRYTLERRDALETH